MDGSWGGKWHKKKTQSAGSGTSGLFLGSFGLLGSLFFCEIQSNYHAPALSEHILDMFINYAHVKFGEIHLDLIQNEFRGVKLNMPAAFQ